MRAPGPNSTSVPVHHGGDLIVDVLGHVERGPPRYGRDHLGRERVADDAAGDAGLGADLLLEVEVEHVVVDTAGKPR